MLTVPPPDIMARASAMTAAGQEPRRHHTVPRFYLRRWATDDMVAVTDLSPKRHSYTASTGKASIVKDFYRLDETGDAGVSPVMWEVWLSGIEARAAPVLDELERRDVEGLDLDQRLALTTFLASFHTRTRGHSDRLRQSKLASERAIIADAPDAYLAGPSRNCAATCWLGSRTSSRRN
jgi:hypothetical protein